MAVAEGSIPCKRLALCNWPSSRTWITLAVILFAGFTSCSRLEIFASADEPPSPEWRRRNSLENQPVVVGNIRERGELGVTMGNQGTTTLMYSAAATGRRRVACFSEREENGAWRRNGWEWCGTGREVFELAPGKQVDLYFEFDNPGRERVLTMFMEKGTELSGLVVLASEGPRLAFDAKKFFLPATAIVAALGIWMTVRVVNRVAHPRA